MGCGYGALGLSPAPPLASREVEGRRVFLRNGSGLFGSPHGLVGGPVSVPALCLFRSAVSLMPERQGHPLLGSPLQSSFVPTPAPALSGGALLPGFRTLITTSPVRPLTRRFPGLRYVPSSGAPNLSTVFSALGFLGLFRPRAVSRVLIVQGLLSPLGPPPSSGGGAPLPLRRPCSASVSPPATTTRLGFEAFIRARPRSLKPGD